MTNQQINEIEKMMDEVHRNYFKRIIELKKINSFSYSFLGDNAILDILINKTQISNKKPKKPKKQLRVLA